jgi:fatty acid desaturase
VTEPVDQPLAGPSAEESDGGTGPTPGPSAPIFVAGVVLYAAAGLGAAAIGGWIGIGLVFLLAAAVIGALIVVS